MDKLQAKRVYKHHLIDEQFLMEIGELARWIEERPERARGKAQQIRALVEKALAEQGESLE